MLRRYKPTITPNRLIYGLVVVLLVLAVCVCVYYGQRISTGNCSNPDVPVSPAVQGPGMSTEINQAFTQ